MKPFQEFQ